MKRFNKFLALFLAVVMAVGLLPAGVSAAADPNVIYEQNFEDYTTELANEYNPKAYDVPYHHLYNQYKDGEYSNTSDIVTENGNTFVRLNATKHNVTSWTPAGNNSIGLFGVGLNPSHFTASTEYKFTVRVKADVAGRNTVIDVYDVGSSHIINEKATVQTVGTEWTDLEIRFTTPADISTLAAVRFRVGYEGYYTNDDNAYLMVDNVRISKVVPYSYSSIEDELADGNAKLQDDVDGTGEDLVLKAGKTLDLNGHTLTVDSLTALKGANVIDSAGGGKLVVAEEALLLQKTNRHLPIKVDGGYIFAAVKNQHEPMDAEADTLKYKTRPSLVNVTSSTYLGDGAADNGLSIMIRLTWTNTVNGTTTTMDVPCSDELVKDVYTNKGAFVLSVTGVDSVENLQVATVICSDTGVVFVGDALSY